MRVLVLNHTEVDQLLPMPECIAAMEAAFTSFARGESQQPLRTIFRPPKLNGVMAMMPAFRAGESPLFSLKAICVFNGTTGELLALVNASAITAIRTAAVSALATRLLAREDARNLAIIGAGVQARPHLIAIAGVRNLKRIRIAAQHFDSAEKFAVEMQPQFSLAIEPVETTKAAV